MSWYTNTFTFTHTLARTHNAQFLSILPARILRLLEFVGFSGERAVGLEELEKGANSNTFRAPLCTSFLLFYYTVALVIMGEEISKEVETNKDSLCRQLNCSAKLADVWTTALR